MDTTGVDIPATYSLLVPMRELKAAVTDRLAAPDARDVVVWSRDRSELIVHRGTLNLRAVAGYLVAEVNVESAETGPTLARLVFYLGTAEAGAGPSVAATFDATTPQLIVDAWGDALRAAVWEGLVDVVEGAAVAASRVAGTPLRVLGVTGEDARIVVAVGA